ncbi:MAG: hypothetical protein HY918_00515 [Candidatus Doudnabacteria bacterium]|nr:hypothetical protein [Candidatus Doudnabacteria bacterium]
MSNNMEAGVERRGLIDPKIGVAVDAQYRLDEKAMEGVSMEKLLEYQKSLNALLQAVGK